MTTEAQVLDALVSVARDGATASFHFADPDISGRINPDGTITIDRMAAVSAHQLQAIVRVLRRDDPLDSLTPEQLGAFIRGEL